MDSDRSLHVQEEVYQSTLTFDLLVFTSQFCPKSNLIKDKILVLGLDIVEHKVYYYFVTSDMTQCCTQFALYALQLR